MKILCFAAAFFMYTSQAYAQTVNPPQESESLTDAAESDTGKEPVYPRPHYSGHQPSQNLNQTPQTEPIPLPEINPTERKHYLDAPAGQSNNGKLASPGRPPIVRHRIVIEPSYSMPSKPHQFYNAGTWGGAPFSSTAVFPAEVVYYFPYSAVGKILTQYPSDPPGKLRHCSASVIGKRLILTAGHCIHSGLGVTSYYGPRWFIPAAMGSQARYYAWKVVYYRVPQGWAKARNNAQNSGLPSAYDFALLVVQDQNHNRIRRSVSDYSGILGIATQAPLHNHAKLLGYPLKFSGGNYLHQVDSQAFKLASGPSQTQATAIEYGSDMTQGSSGGPWVQNFGWPAQGQTGGSQPHANFIIGVTSYMLTPGNQQMIQGSSLFNSNFDQFLASFCKGQPAEFCEGVKRPPGL